MSFSSAFYSHLKLKAERSRHCNFLFVNFLLQNQFCIVQKTINYFVEKLSSLGYLGISVHRGWKQSLVILRNITWQNILTTAVRAGQLKGSILNVPHLQNDSEKLLGVNQRQWRSLCQNFTGENWSQSWTWQYTLYLKCPIQGCC